MPALPPPALSRVFPAQRTRRLSQVDNSELIELIDGKQGVLAQLRSQCYLPKGSDNGFMRDVWRQNSGNRLLRRPYSTVEHPLGEDDGFRLAHFHARVQYEGVNPEPELLAPPKGAPCPVPRRAFRVWAGTRLTASSPRIATLVPRTRGCCSRRCARAPL